MFSFIKNFINIKIESVGIYFGKQPQREVYTKDNVNILFIDNLDMPVVESLKKAGYKVKKVKDIRDVDDIEVKNAQIIFVDFDGVGRSISPHHQGAGLVKELKNQYRQTKYIVLYTEQPTMPADTVMSELFSIADDRMTKDSDVTDFIEQIRDGLKRLV
jgi:hypothetical protein